MVPQRRFDVGHWATAKRVPKRGEIRSRFFKRDQTTRNASFGFEFTKRVQQHFSGRRSQFLREFVRRGIGLVAAYVELFAVAGMHEVMASIGVAARPQVVGRTILRQINARQVSLPSNAPVNQGRVEWARKRFS